jgi:hypothetical protein
MRRVRLVFPLTLGTLLACQPADDPSAAPDPVSPATPAPSFGATALKIPNDYFLILDEDPTRNYTTTFGICTSL